MTMRQLLFASLAFASVMTSATANADLIRPDMSEVESFEAEWCAPNVAPQEAATGIITSSSAKSVRVEVVCFGETKFQGASTVRALAFKLHDKTKELYIDSDFRGVTLMKPQFTILGPVKGTVILASETGEAAVAIDARGEVKAVKAWTPRHGSILAFRDQKRSLLDKKQ